MPATNGRATLAACGEPYTGPDRACGSGGWCARRPGHEGRHTEAGDTCNRPAGHDGDHMVLGWDAVRLARWPRVVPIGRR